jgi:plasmid stabilization system protein ParE
VPSLIWSRRALLDLDRLHRFLATHDPQAARRAIGAIRAGMRLIEAHPEAGRRAGGMEEAFRERWISFGHSGYLVLYRLDSAHVVVLAVRHGRELAT